MTVQGPIGVFDSGVGGLSVLREIRRELPAEDLLYVADSAYAPYGEQSDALIHTRSLAIAAFLLARSAKAIVVACNTATSVAVEVLRARVPVPVVAMEPAVKPAARHTKSTVVGVLATTRTLESARFTRLLTAHGLNVRVLLQPCPGFVEQVERGLVSGPDTCALVERYVNPLVAQGADTLVLGCTHYPFLLPVIRAVAGPGVSVIDPSPAVARELRRRLETADRLSSQETPGTSQFWTSGAPEAARAVISQLWEEEVEVRRWAEATESAEASTPRCGTGACPNG